VVARPRGARENTKNKGLAWLTTFNADTDLQGLSPASANLSDDGPPDCENKTAGNSAKVAGGEIKTKASQNLQTTDYAAPVHLATAKIPSRATLARRFPRLRVNRFTGSWRDFATGAHGRDIASLLAFLEQGRAGQ